MERKILNRFFILIFFVLILYFVSLFIPNSFLGKITGNVILDPHYCNRTINNILYNASSNNLTSADSKILCFEGNLYRCGVLNNPSLNNLITYVRHNQQIGNWRCSEHLKVWVPSSGCVFNWNNLNNTRDFAYNNTFGYHLNTTNNPNVVFKQDTRFYCLNGEYYSCGYVPANNIERSFIRNLSNENVVGNFKCFNQSGKGIFFPKEFGCIRYFPTINKFYFGKEMEIGIKEFSFGQINNPHSLREIQSRDNSYLCYNNSWYYCGQENPSFATKLRDGDILRNTWRCKNNQFEFIKPRISLARDECECEKDCGPFEFLLEKDGLDLSENKRNLNVTINYNLFNGTKIKRTFDFGMTEEGNLLKRRVSFNLTCKDLRVKIMNGTLEARLISSMDNLNNSAFYNFNINKGFCLDQCNFVGQAVCVTRTTKKTCGYYNSSNSCLTWGTEERCHGGTLCREETGICELGGQTDTCTPVGGICVSTLPSNATNIQKSCPWQGDLCIKCKQNFSWNGSSCILTSCPTGFHLYNNSCVSNNCSGIEPLGNNVIKGSSVYFQGIKNWSFVPLPIFGALAECQWSCQKGFRKNSTGNGCEQGKHLCNNISGICRNSSLGLSEGMINVSEYAYCSDNNYYCVICNITDGYFFNGTLCEKRCNAGFFWNGSACVLFSLCQNPNKPCYFEGKCFSIGFRIGNRYCSSTGFVNQKELNASCNNNYECQTNFCDPTRKCVDLINEINKASNFLRRVYCWINNGFNIRNQGYINCIASN